MGTWGRNFLRAPKSDAMNTLLCGAGHNLCKILRRLALLYTQILKCLQCLGEKQNENNHRLMMAVC
jgi:IS5 family transposase